MNLSIGIVGLPNVGKSTLFNALLKKQVALAANYPFATIEPNVGIVDVPDPRLTRLASLINDEYGAKISHKQVPEKVIPAVVKFYEIAGLVKGAHKGEGLGNQFLGHIREVDAIVHVVRVFTDSNIIREGSTDPLTDIDTINMELIFADLQSIEKKAQKLADDLRRSKASVQGDIGQVCNKIAQCLQLGKPASAADLSDAELEIAKELNLLTQKPMIYVLNVAEDALGRGIEELIDTSNTQYGFDAQHAIKISARLEEELASLEGEDREAFMQELGINVSGLDKLITRAYNILNLQTYFTAGPKEVHAWTYEIGTKAPQAAGIIHTDFERGFISAQVCSYKNYVECKTWKGALDKGLIRLEGKEYVMQDGDIVEFRFGV
ncbi:MAG: hypothetical protein RLY61_967 [Candidatus Parcubacteria bacterium]|jgi:GTP-binding protein YchF